MVSQKYGLKLSKINSGTLIGLPFSFTKTKCTWASTTGVWSFVINWCIKKEVLVIDLTNDLIFRLSSKRADFLKSILHDLTIINAPNFSLIWRLLNPIEAKASVLALSRYLR